MSEEVEFDLSEEVEDLVQRAYEADTYEEFDDIFDDAFEVWRASEGVQQNYSLLLPFLMLENRDWRESIFDKEVSLTEDEREDIFSDHQSTPDVPDLGDVILYEYEQRENEDLGEEFNEWIEKELT